MEQVLGEVLRAIVSADSRRVEKEFLRRRAVVAAVESGTDVYDSSGAQRSLCHMRDEILAAAGKKLGVKYAIGDLQVLLKEQGFRSIANRLASCNRARRQEAHPDVLLLEDVRWP